MCYAKGCIIEFLSHNVLLALAVVIFYYFSFYYVSISLFVLTEKRSSDVQALGAVLQWRVAQYVYDKRLVGVCEYFI